MWREGQRENGGERGFFITNLMEYRRVFYESMHSRPSAQHWEHSSCSIKNNVVLLTYILFKKLIDHVTFFPRALSPTSLLLGRKDGLQPGLLTKSAAWLPGGVQSVGVKGKTLWVFRVKVADVHLNGK